MVTRRVNRREPRGERNPSRHDGNRGCGAGLVVPGRARARTPYAQPLRSALSLGAVTLCLNKERQRPKPLGTTPDCG